jgi:peptide-methionine (S)-S-oxide reductase
MNVLPNVMILVSLLSVAIVSSDAFQIAVPRNQAQKLSLSAIPSPTDEPTEKKKDNNAMAFLRKVGKVGGDANIDYTDAVGVDEGSTERSEEGAKLLKDSAGAGAQAATIPYEKLDHPGPELGKFAEEGTVPAMSPKDPNLALATFAGGCFWGLELAYMRVPGVVHTAVGYSQGPAEVKYPYYSQVCSGGTGHTEAVIVYYDPKETSYEALLDVFFVRVDPTTVNGQGNDFGTQYRTGVYTHSPEQEVAAKARFAEEQTKYAKPMASENLPATAFWPAEKYHQQYLEKGGQNANKEATDTIRCYG